MEDKKLIKVLFVLALVYILCAVIVALVPWFVGLLMVQEIASTL